MKKIQFLAVATLLFVSGCAKGNNIETKQESSINQEDTVFKITLPRIPDELKEPADRADYLIRHYWDNLDFNDTAKSLNSDFMEQSLVDFLYVLPYASSEKVVSDGFSIMLDKASINEEAYKKLTGIADDYLYNPNSPMLSEEQYIIYLDALIKRPNLSESQKIRLEDRIEMVSKNRTGTKATDFTYEKPDGSVSSLYQSLPAKGKDMMLIFFDPECESCEEVLARLKDDENLNASLEEGSIEVLAIYSGDNVDSWRRKVEELPATWTIGINKHEIEDNDLYFFPGMPTIYIIDSEGIVRAKDLHL